MASPVIISVMDSIAVRRDTVHVGDGLGVGLQGWRGRLRFRQLWGCRQRAARVCNELVKSELDKA